MNIFNKIKEKLSNEFIDIVEWLDYTPDTVAHRFERYQNEIKNGAQLVVREGQMAVFINEGKLADVFKPGTYELTTQNLPILTTLKGWKFGFNSPFKAEVYFVNTRLFTDEKWGTRSPITLNDERFGMVEIRAFGTFAFKVQDAGIFIKEIVGTDKNFTNYEINEHLKSLIASKFADTAGEANLPIELYAANTTELSETCQEVMSVDFGKVGIGLERFYIENVSLPEELKKEIFELSRLDKINIQKLTQYKTAKAIEEAAKQEGGLAGGGLGMGMGFEMARQMGQSMQNSNTPQQSAFAPNTPPPLAQAVSYFYALDNQQHGPVDFAQIQKLFANRTLNRKSLVWKQGFGNWTAIEDVNEFQSFLGGATPPPLPSN